MTVDQRDDVWLVEAFEDINFGGKIIFQLLVEL